MNQNQPQNKTPNLSRKDELGQIDEKEYELLYWLRTRFRYGEVTIMVRDGKPFRIVKAFETEDL